VHVGGQPDAIAHGDPVRGWLARLACPVGLSGWLARLACPVGLPGWLARLACPVGLPGWLARLLLLAEAGECDGYDEEDGQACGSWIERSHGNHLAECGP